MSATTEDAFNLKCVNNNKKDMKKKYQLTVG